MYLRIHPAPQPEGGPNYYTFISAPASKASYPLLLLLAPPRGSGHASFVYGGMGHWAANSNLAQWLANDSATH